MYSQTDSEESRDLQARLVFSARDAARSNPAEACCRFGMSLEQVEALAQATPTAIFSLVSRLGNEPLFTLRPDIARLLEAPAPIQAAMAVSRTLSPVTSREGH